jgi:hypothetical protein
MIWSWVILAVYVAGFLFSWRAFALKLIEYDIRAYPDLARDPQEMAGFRMNGAGFGFPLALFWPAAWVVLVLTRGIRALVQRSSLLVTKLERDREKAARDRAELDALRSQARELGLPMPEFDPAARHVDGTDVRSVDRRGW